MKKVLLIFLWGILVCQISNAQNSKLDSLKTIWESNSQRDSIRYEAGLDLFMLQFRKSLDTARVTGYELLDFALDKKNPSWEATALKFIGNHL